MPILDDNFAYLLIDESGVAAAVDPAEPEKVSTSQSFPINMNSRKKLCAYLLEQSVTLLQKYKI